MNSNRPDWKKVEKENDNRNERREFGRRDRNQKRSRHDNRSRNNRDRFRKHSREDYLFGAEKKSNTRPSRERMILIREIEKKFDRLVAVDPHDVFKFETSKGELTTRLIDLFAPIGRGQRAMIVAPPKTGKTIMLQKIAHALNVNHPEVRVIALLVDERPEEVTDFRRSVPAEVIASCSDQTVNEHVKAVEDTFLAARQSALEGKDVVILLDSLTRLARAYNQFTESSGKTLTGGLDSAAMQRPRKFFGAARKIDQGGSLTVIATALIETGSRMDDIIFQEFKGTGNTEIVLSRKLAEQRMFPSLDLIQTSTRREEKLFSIERLMKMRILRRAISSLSPYDAMVLLLDKINKYETNDDFLKTIPVR